MLSDVVVDGWLNAFDLRRRVIAGSAEAYAALDTPKVSYDVGFCI